MDHRVEPGDGDYEPRHRPAVTADGRIIDVNQCILMRAAVKSVWALKVLPTFLYLRSARHRANPVEITAELPEISEGCGLSVCRRASELR